MFLDEAKICLQGGRGGNGIISFSREKFSRGPDGGDGGRGGDVILKADPNISTLLKFKNQIHFKASRGGDGGPGERRGKDGKDIIVTVPVGTVVKDLRTRKLLVDLTTPGDECTLARGGEGGRGNAHFKSSTRRAPRICERGGEGEEIWVKLELKLLADVGIIGYPNVGKSTLISHISAQKPKIAPYPFTTLEPNLGVVQVDGAEFVAVDIPGLIEGSHQGKGLGDRFLRHVERALVLVHLVDISSAEGRDPLDDYYKINHELALFSKALREKPQIVAGNKIDLITEEEVKNQIRRFKREGIELIPISAARGDRVRKLVWLCHLKLKELKPTKKAKTKRKLYRYEEPFWVSKEGEVFVVEGKAPERLCRLCLDTKDALEYFYESLDRLGVLGELKRRGLKKGDIIRICGQEFEYS